MQFFIWIMKPTKKWPAIVTAWLLLLSAMGAITGSCSTNPATGKTQFNIISEQQEIQLGRENDALVIAQLGLYDDPELAAYVQNLGLALARLSERPELPWTFRVVDDPTVNALALPGGFVYVTRGILTYMTTEAELAGVIGHEIAHITAQHAVQRISSQTLVQLGLGIGIVVAPELQNFSSLIGAGLSLLYLKFSRDDESQSDQIGLRYMVKAGYDPRQLINVMAMLSAVSRAAPGTRLPEWLSTHPDPGNRETTIMNEIAAQRYPTTGVLVNRDAFLDQVNGIVFGPDPRTGYFANTIFYHPNLRLRFDFPNNWQTTNDKLSATGVSPQEDALLQIGFLGDKQTADAAANQFFSQQGLRTGGTRRTTINGFPAIWGDFNATVQGTELQGLAAFVSYGNNTYQLLGYSAAADWSNYQQTVANSFNSFNQVTDPAVLLVQPERMNVVTVNTPMTLTEYNRRFPAALTLPELALLNQITVDTQLTAGQRLKTVVR